MAKKFFWLKLKADFFKSLQMKKLRKIAGGDTYTIIYLKMQLLSIKDNGVLYYQGIEESLADELALALDEEVDNVQATILFLEKCKLIEQTGTNEYLLTEVPFLIGSETDKAELMRIKRAKDKEKQLENGNNVTTPLLDVTDCYTEIEIEKEIEIDKEKDKELETETEGEKRETEREKTDYQQVVNAYNDTCVSLPRVNALSDARRKAIRARLNRYSVDDLKKVFQKAEASDFLKGANPRNWTASFDWLLKDANIAKVLDGNYDNHTRDKPVAGSYGNRVAQQLDDSYDMLARWANGGG